MQIYRLYLFTNPPFPEQRCEFFTAASDEVAKVVAEHFIVGRVTGVALAESFEGYGSFRMLWHKFTDDVAPSIERKVKKWYK